MPAATVDTADAVMQQRHEGPLGKIIDLSLNQYESAKDGLAKNATLGRLTPMVEWTEGTTRAILKRSPIAVDTVVSAVDTRAEAVVNYSSEKLEAVRAAPTETLGYVHGKLQELRVEAAQPVPKEDLTVSGVVVEGKEAAAERLNVLLDAGEGYLKQYLPIEDDEPELQVEGPKSEIKTVAKRTVSISKVAALKATTRAFEKAGELQKRTKETVHVDLIKYNDWLDANVKAPVSKRLQIVDEKLAISEKVEVVDAKLIKPIKAGVAKRVDAVDAKLVQPAKEKFVLVVSTISEKYNEKVVVPREQIIEMFKEELAIQQSIAKSRTGDEELTIAAGLSAVIAAARSRLQKEYEVRVSPALARFLGREARESEEEEEEEEAESFGDAAEDMEESE